MRLFYGMPLKATTFDIIQKQKATETKLYFIKHFDKNNNYMRMTHQKPLIRLF